MSSFFALLFVVATLVLVVGVARKIIQYARTPAPLKIPTTPAPVNQAGVVLRLFREVVFFESLFKSTKWTWIFGWMFHVALLLVLLRHLRYFTEPVWFWVDLIQPFPRTGSFPSGRSKILWNKWRHFSRRSHRTRERREKIIKQNDHQ